MVDARKMPLDDQEIFDGVYVLIKTCKWIYDCAIDEGFDKSQAMFIVNSYISNTLGASLGMKKNG